MQVTMGFRKIFHRLLRDDLVDCGLNYLLKDLQETLAEVGSLAM